MLEKNRVGLAPPDVSEFVDAYIGRSEVDVTSHFSCMSESRAKRYHSGQVWDLVPGKKYKASATVGAKIHYPQ